MLISCQTNKNDLIGIWKCNDISLNIKNETDVVISSEVSELKGKYTINKNILSIKMGNEKEDLYIDKKNGRLITIDENGKYDIRGIFYKNESDRLKNIPEDDYLIGIWKGKYDTFQIGNQSTAIWSLEGTEQEGTYIVLSDSLLVSRCGSEYFELYIDKANKRLISMDKGKLNEKQSYYKDGIKNGIVRTYHSDNQIEKIENYKDNKREGQWKEYYSDGQLEKEYEYKNDKLDGQYRYYHTNGDIIEEGLYKDDKKEGIWKKNYLPSFEEYYTNGVLIKTVYEGENGKEEIYENGASKKVVFYNKDGIRQSEGYYENETLIKVVEFDENGDIR